jgi:hypothetical protein
MSRSSSTRERTSGKPRAALLILTAKRMGKRVR